jgi:hypothetical protein
VKILAGHPARHIAVQFFARGARHMPRISFSASIAVLLRNAIGSVVAFLNSAWDGPVGKYRPEDHYMRGPGPKWREKHFLDRASAGGT